MQSAPIPGLFCLVYLITGALALLARVCLGPPSNVPIALEGYLVAAGRDLRWWCPGATLGTLASISFSYWLHQGFGVSGRNGSAHRPGARSKRLLRR